MSRIIDSHSVFLPVLLFLATLILDISGNNAWADSSRFYLGASGDVVRGSFEHAKTVDNTGVPDGYLQQGNSYSETENMNKTGFGGRLFAGYQLHLDPSGTTWLAIEAGAGLDDGEPKGMFAGKGTSAGRNQLGELWPDKLTLERKFHYEASVLLGVRPGALISLLGPGSGLYVLGGIRRLHTELTSDYNGCLSTDRLCTETELTQGSVSYDKTLSGWMVGGGIEKMIGKAGIRAEVRHTQYAKKDWDGWEDVGPDIPLSLDGDETRFSLGVVFYF